MIWWNGKGIVYAKKLIVSKKYKILKIQDLIVQSQHTNYALGPCSYQQFPNR